MEKPNCWEHLGCGRTTCVARTESRLHGVHGGHNAGRACWAVAGTTCGGKSQGEYARKIGSCMDCDFFQRVTREESPTGLVNDLRLLEILQASP